MNKPFDADVTLLFGVGGYILASIAGGLLVALLMLVAPRLHLLSTTLSHGAIRVILAGFVMSILGIPYAEKMFGGSTSAINGGNMNCTESAIDSQFQAMRRLDNELARSILAGSIQKPRKFSSDATKIWSSDIICTEGDSTQLSPKAHGEFLDTMLIGHADSVVVFFDAQDYVDARNHVNEYLGFANSARPIAVSKGWGDWLKLEAKLTKGIGTYDEALRKKGHP
jgi:hypothetical protein